MSSPSSQVKALFDQLIWSFVVLGPIWERQSLLQDTCLAILYISDEENCQARVMISH